jgi:cytochrome c oxidase subunit 2
MNCERRGSVVVTALVPPVTVLLFVVAESVTGELIRGLNRRLLYIAVPIALLVEVILLYAVWRYTDSEEPQPTRKNRRLEITWTAATAIVLLFVGTASFSVLKHPYVADVSHQDSHSHSHGDGTPDDGSGVSGPQPGTAPPDAAEVIVIGEQWEYTFAYPDADETTADELVVPVDRPVYVYVVSEDVLHSLHVPALGLKQDIFPGQYNLLRTRLLDEGEHRVYCAEYCGDGHATMRATLTAVSASEYESFLDELQESRETDTRTEQSIEPTARRDRSVEE